jgi:hypothetical protein
MPTFIHGIAASENIDSSGERILMDGLDISSLEKDGVFNYEHESKNPSQVVGKILKAKKIFSEQDCDDDHQMNFWNKIKTPYLYVMGELFDDYTDSAKDIAGKFRYDLDKKGQNERPVMNFSIEGAKIDKKGVDIVKSIARKVTITVLPCNKVAVAEMIASDNRPKDDLDGIFKAENKFEIELLKDEKSELFALLNKKEDHVMHASKLGIDPMKKEGLQVTGTPQSASSLLGSEKMEKAQVPGSKYPPASAAQPKSSDGNVPKFGPIPTKSRDLGKQIGTTKSGKAVMSHAKPLDYKGWSAQDHQDAANIHYGHTEEGKGIPGATHFDTAKRHMAIAGRGERHQATAAAKRTAALARPDMNTPKMNRSLPTMENQAMMPPPNFPDKAKVAKALTAGSMMSAPGNMVQGAALGKESLERKAQKVNKMNKDGQTLGAAIGFPGAAQTAPVPAPSPSPVTKKEKSKWLSRAEEEYSKWDKREEFRKYMSERLPNLTKGEIDAIGQVLALSKTMRMEKALKKLAKQYSAYEPMHSYTEFKSEKPVEKFDDVVMGVAAKGSDILMENEPNPKKLKKLFPF